MQRRVSPRTIASYRDSLKLLLTFASQQTGKSPSALDWADLIGAFLDHLEAQRHNAIRTRNLRLTAIRALFTYAALRHPEHAALIQQVYQGADLGRRPRRAHLWLSTRRGAERSHWPTPHDRVVHVVGLPRNVLPDRQHLLHRLARHAHLAGDVSL